jgi:hypothetical protein
MNASAFLNTSTVRVGRKPQLARAHVVPHARRHRLQRPLLGPSLLSLAPFDTLFDLKPSQLLETEEFMGMERARAMAVDFLEVRPSIGLTARET